MWVVKSGTDFRNYTEIRATVPVEGRATFECTQHNITGEYVHAETTSFAGALQLFGLLMVSPVSRITCWGCA